MLTVYGRENSSNVRKVLWTLDELDLAYERIDFGRGYASTDSDTYRAINPAGLVPALRDGELVIAESNTIIRYLIRREGATELLPDDISEAARVEQWMDWQSAEMVRPFNPLFIGGHLKLPPHNNPADQKRAHDDAIAKMEILNGQLSRTGAYVVNDRFSAADLCVGVHVHRWFVLDIDRPNFAALAVYYDRLSEREAYRTHVRNGQP